MTFPRLRRYFAAPFFRRNNWPEIRSLRSDYIQLEHAFRTISALQLSAHPTIAASYWLADHWLYAPPRAAASGNPLDSFS
jgi:hypothetical protein